MKLIIKQWPESQEVMDKDDWFFIQSEPYDILGSSCYAKIIKDKEFDNWEEIATEDLWMDGELTRVNVVSRIMTKVLDEGTWKLIRRKHDK